jgi:mRNA interferase MazF
LCQITSNPYSDAAAIRLTNAELKLGVLSAVSYARPIKLFTANESLMVKRIAVLKDETFKAILTATIEALRKNLPS